MKQLGLFLLLVPSVSLASPQLDDVSELHPGIEIEEWSDATIPVKIHLVRVDLTSAEIGVFATAELDRGITPGQYATRKSAQVVLNGDAFASTSYRPLGLAAGDGVPWSMTADTEASAMFHFRRVGERTEAAIEPPETVKLFTDLPGDTSGVVSGRPLLVRAGAVESAFDCADPRVLACVRGPRSAAALNGDGSRLLLVAVDGWQEASIGLTAAELASFLVARGAVTALAFDGGSSTALILDGALASAPSDGVQRAVANHVAIKYGELPVGRMVGFVCENSIFDCDPVTGADVRLDDDRTDRTLADGVYEFAGVTPRRACVTVSKLGFRTATKCVDVMPGDNPPTYNSVLLEPGMDPPDAGIEDAAVPPDSTDLVDGEPRPDGGTPATDGGDGDGCCEATGRPDGRTDGSRDLTRALMVALVAWMLTRRRGTTTGA